MSRTPQTWKGKEYGSSERQRHIDDARDRFTRAAASLTQWWTDDNLAFALMEVGRGMLSLAQADPDRRAYDRVQAALAAVKALEEPTP